MRDESSALRKALFLANDPADCLIGLGEFKLKPLVFGIVDRDKEPTDEHSEHHRIEDISPGYPSNSLHRVLGVKVNGRLVSSLVTPGCASQLVLHSRDQCWFLDRLARLVMYRHRDYPFLNVLVRADVSNREFR